MNSAMSQLGSLQTTKRHIFPYSALAIAFFSILMALALISLLSGRVSVTADFMSMIPTYGIDEGVSQAERRFLSARNASASIIFSHADFEAARGAAQDFYSRMLSSGAFSSLSLDAGGISAAEISSMLEKSRYALIPESLMEEIRLSPAGFQENSLSLIFSPLSLFPLSSLDRDPFFLDGAIMARLISRISSIAPVMPREGVLAAEHGGMWHVLAQGTLSPESLDITNVGGGIEAIYKTGDALEEEREGLKISYSGFPFHSYENASSAQREAAAITAASILLIAAMFLILLRNIRIIGLFLLGIALSLLAGFLSLAAFFSEIHILTMIFGTSLIGTSIDYSIHYYLAYAKRGSNEDGFAVVKRLSVNLAVSLASTVLCYALLAFSPYGILRQVGTFSFFGLIGSFLAVTGFFPLIAREGMISKGAPLWRAKPMRPHRSYIPLLFAAALALLAFSSRGIKVSNNVAGLYRISERLLESERTAAAVLGFMSTSYAIIEGDDELDAREKEAAFSRSLDTLEEGGEIGRYLSPSLFIPPPSAMEESIRLSREVLAPMVESQCEILGLESGAALAAIEESSSPLLLSSLPESVSAMLESLVPGEIGGKYYIIAMIFDAAEGLGMREIANAHEGVTYFQKARDVNAQLDALTHVLLRFFLIALALIFVLVVAVFRKKGFRLMASPVIIVSFLLSSMALMGKDIDFFFAVGMLLVIGLGLDYMVFAANGEAGALAAISLCYITTALSFGSLAASSFPPVHIFGLAVIIGITAAWACALAAEVKARE